MYNTRSKTKSESCAGELSTMENNKNNIPVDKTQSELQSLIQLLTLKMQREEVQQKSTNVSIEVFSKMVPEFDGENIAIEHWFDIFEKNANAYGLDIDQKYAQARHKMSGAAKLFVDALVICTYEDLKRTVTEEFKRSYSTFNIHKTLTDRKKKSTETFHEYILQMRKIASLGNVDVKSQIRYIVDGLRIKNEYKFNLYLSQSFNELREAYETYEAITLKGTVDGDEYQVAPNKPRRQREEHCFNCGSKEHKRAECKSASKCFKCNKFGHIAKNCTANGDGKHVNIVENKGRFKKVWFNDAQLECLIDTGSDVSLMRQSIYNSKYGETDIRSSSSVLFGLGNVKTKPVGVITGTLGIDEIKTNHEFLVVEDKNLKCEAIIGYDLISKYVLHADENGYTFEEKKCQQEENEQMVYSVTEIDVNMKCKDQVERIIKDYNTTSRSEYCPVSMKITPNENMRPFHHSPSRLAADEENAVNQQVEEWLQKNIIRRSYSDTASRVVVRKKKSGEYRICIDFRQLNKMVLKDRFPVPVVEEVLQKLQKGKYFTVMDLRNGFLHVPIEETSKKYTAFVTKRGIFEFNRAPFGFCNSPAYFIRYLNYIFQDLINDRIMELYVDDIVVWDECMEECIGKLKTVVQKAAEYGLEFNWGKCVFMKTKIEFLGHVVQNGTIRPGELKTRAVENFPIPKSIKDVQSFLGLSGYFRKFIENYAIHVRPLTDLLKKNVQFNMGENEIKAINIIKGKLSREPVLRLYNRDAETEVHTDASKHGFGAAIIQKYNDQLHPVFFWSKIK